MGRGDGDLGFRGWVVQIKGVGNRERAGARGRHGAIGGRRIETLRGFSSSVEGQGKAGSGSWEADQRDGWAVDRVPEGPSKRALGRCSKELRL